jgi:glycerol-3-phosphate cytidylyltransferase
MRVGYLPGVFDLFHIGHKNIIDKALQHCDTLVIGIHTDEFVTEYKRRPVQSEQERLNAIAQVYGRTNIHYTIVGKSHLETITKYAVTHVFHGSDWELESYKRQIRYYEDKLNVEIMILPYTDSISTTKIISLSRSYRGIDYFLFDLDKTLLLNGEPTHGAVECIQYIQSKYKYNVITNNNKYTPTEIATSLHNIGIHIPVEFIRTPLVMIRDYLRETGVTKAFIWGTASARDFLREFSSSMENAELLVVLYNDVFDYADLTELATAARHKPYIISNIDFTYPDKHLVLPDTGITQQLLQLCTGNVPLRVFGKPNVDMCCVENPVKCLMVGDSLKTDGKLAENLGVQFYHVTDVQDLSLLCTILRMSQYDA